jgi:tripartite-type tricarboxylate transporter receptor subunit TctC
MRLLRTTLLLTLAVIAVAAQAAYPDKPIKVVLGFAAGGGSDILLRKIAPAIGDALGQTLVVENQPGAGGNLAMSAVAHAAPDGYTLLMGSPGLATNSSLYANLGFDPLKDFTPVAMVGSVQNVLLVRRDLPVNSVAELIAYAKQNPGKLNYASPGVGTSLHLAAELFKVNTGAQMVHVPYKGGAQALNDLMGGQVDLMFNVLPSAMPQIKAGNVKALAVTGAKRAATLPELPTMIEAGVPGYTAVTWNGIVAPAGTPKEIVTKLNEAIVRVLRTPEMQHNLAEIGQDVLVGTPEQFGTLIRDETAKWKRTIEAAGIKAQ